MHVAKNAAFATAALAAMLAAAPALAQDAENTTASAELAGPDGESFGTVALVETPNGVLVQLDAKGLPAGGHGFHLHETGKCDAPDFKSAGGHFNPGGKSHGILSENGPHAGDMPNIQVGEDGVARADVFLTGAVITEGENALMDDDGAAVVIHSGIDDYETDPAGDAGDRIACGVIAAAQ